jgi:hypothetical protein
LSDKFEKDETVKNVNNRQSEKRYNLADNGNIVNSVTGLNAIFKEVYKSMTSCDCVCKTSIHCILHSEKLKLYILRLLHAMNEDNPDH